MQARRNTNVLFAEMLYDMKKFFEQSVALYQKLAPGFDLQAAETPFIDEDIGVQNPTRAPQEGPGLICPQCTEAFPEAAFTKTASPAEALKLCKEIRANLNEYIEAVEEAKKAEGGGVLNLIAARVVMNIFYGARCARPDLLRAIGHLTRYLTKWDAQCDARLHALVYYLNSTLDHHCVGWVGDDISEVRLHLYTDSDFAGCQRSNKCTSGVFLVLEGPHTYFPIGYRSKMMTSVAYSTPEGELAAMGFGLRHCGYPGMVMWEIMSGQGALKCHDCISQMKAQDKECTKCNCARPHH